MFSFLRIYLRQAKRLPAGSINFVSLVRNYFQWRKTILPGRSTLSDGMPWITFDAIRFLKKNLKSNMRVFEYGSGGSSVFFSRLTTEVISIEHDKEWFNLVNDNISKRGIQNWKGILHIPQTALVGFNKDPEDPRAYSTSDKINIDFSFENYVKSIDKFSDNYFDLIVVDGRSRPSCIMHSIPKLKKGGSILVDNADRISYQKAIDEFISVGFIDEVDTFGPASHSLEFTKTLIRRKLK